MEKRMVKSLPILPQMQCDPNCDECCGPILITEKEFKIIKKYTQEKNIKPIDHENLTCPWFQNGSCSIHETRPLICRVFGHSEHLVCNRGYNQNIDYKIIQQLLLDNGISKVLMHKFISRTKEIQAFDFLLNKFCEQANLRKDSKILIKWRKTVLNE